MREIAKTALFDNATIVTYAVANDKGGYDIRVSVDSNVNCVKSFARKLFTIRDFDRDYDLVNDAMKIHLRLCKRARRKIYRRARTLWYEKVFRAQNGICYLCNTPMMRKQISKEHVIPASKGGKTSQRNILLAHGPCNSKKGDRDPTPEELAYAARIFQEANRIHI